MHALFCLHSAPRYASVPKRTVSVPCSSAQTMHRFPLPWPSGSWARQGFWNMTRSSRTGRHRRGRRMHGVVLHAHCLDLPPDTLDCREYESSGVPNSHPPSTIEGPEWPKSFDKPIITKYIYDDMGLIHQFIHCHCPPKNGKIALQTPRTSRLSTF